MQQLLAEIRQLNKDSSRLSTELCDMSKQLRTIELNLRLSTSDLRISEVSAVNLSGQLADLELISVSNLQGIAQLQQQLVECVAGHFGARNFSVNEFPY